MVIAERSGVYIATDVKSKPGPRNLRSQAEEQKELYLVCQGDARVTCLRAVCASVPAHFTSDLPESPVVPGTEPAPPKAPCTSC